MKEIKKSIETMVNDILASELYQRYHAARTELKKYMNQKISISDLEVIELSKNNDSSDPDIFITAMINDKEISLCVESNLTNVNSNTYQIAENLEVGNIIDVEGFLYWNYGPNPRITTITIK